MEAAATFGLGRKLTFYSIQHGLTIMQPLQVFINTVMCWINAPCADTQLGSLVGAGVLSSLDVGCPNVLGEQFLSRSIYSALYGIC